MKFILRIIGTTDIRIDTNIKASDNTGCSEALRFVGFKYALGNFLS